MSKKSEQKKDKSIAHFKDTVSNSILQRGLFNTVTYDEYIDDYDDEKITATIDMGSYNAIIIASILKGAIIEIDNGIIFKDRDNTRYNINDIFALFETEDFESYLYADLKNDQEIEDAIKVTIDMFLKYDSDIKNADDNFNFPALSGIKSERTKIEENGDIKIKSLLAFGNAFSNYKNKATAKTRNKLIIELQKAEMEGYLAPEDRRVLKKLVAGEDIQFPLSKDDCDKEYGRKTALMRLALNAISLILFLSFGIIFYLRVASNGFTVFNTHLIIYPLIAFVIFTIWIDTSLAEMIIASKFKKQGKYPSKSAPGILNKNKAIKFILGKLFPIIPIIASIVVLTIGCSVTVLTDDYLLDYTLFGSDKISYSALQAYKVLGYSYDDGDEEIYEEYDSPVYEFVDEDKIIYTFGSVTEQKDIDKLQRIFKINKITPTEIKTDDFLVDDLNSDLFNDILDENSDDPVVDILDVAE